MRKCVRQKVKTLRGAKQKNAAKRRARENSFKNARVISSATATERLTSSMDRNDQQLGAVNTVRKFLQAFRQMNLANENAELRLAAALVGIGLEAYDAFTTFRAQQARDEPGGDGGEMAPQRGGADAELPRDPGQGGAGQGARGAPQGLPITVRRGENGETIITIFPAEQNMQQNNVQQDNGQQTNNMQHNNTQHNNNVNFG